MQDEPFHKRPIALSAGIDLKWGFSSLPLPDGGDIPLLFRSELHKAEMYDLLFDQRLLDLMMGVIGMHSHPM